MYQNPRHHSTHRVCVTVYVVVGSKVPIYGEMLDMSQGVDVTAMSSIAAAKLSSSEKLSLKKMLRKEFFC